MDVNQRDVAEFAQLAIRFDFIAPTAVVVWANQLIADYDVPEPWMIELATAKADDIERLLRSVPGTAHRDTPLHLFLSLVLLNWRSGKLDTPEIRKIGWLLSSESLLPKDKRGGSWGDRFSYECEDFDNGWRTKEELVASADQILAEYSAYLDKVPTWAQTR